MDCASFFLFCTHTMPLTPDVAHAPPVLRATAHASPGAASLAKNGVLGNDNGIRPRAGSCIEETWRGVGLKLLALLVSVDQRSTCFRQLFRNTRQYPTTMRLVMFICDRSVSVAERVRGKSHQRVPAGSCHFSCLTDPSQSVVNFPCIRK